MGKRISKRVVDAAQPVGNEYFIWDSDLPGFGLRIRSSGSRTYVFQYRAGLGRSAPTRRLTLGRVGKLTPDQARGLARTALGEMALGGDPAADKAGERKAGSIADLVERFLEHVEKRRKSTTYSAYKYVLQDILVQRFGTMAAHRLSLAELEGLFESLSGTSATANKLLAATSSMYGYAAKRLLVPKGTNPAYGIERFPNNSRDRHLSLSELERLGAALNIAETDGVPWSTDIDASGAKHLRKDHETQRTVICPFAIAAIRLLLFTGCRLREILHLRWDQVDFENRLLHLPDSKTGKKKIVLNTSAMAILKGLPRIGAIVIAGKDPDKPRSDLSKPWRAIKRLAELEDFTLHDLRHSFASVGTAGGAGLPIVAKLLGHSSTQMTERYSHLDVDPLRKVSNRIAKRIAHGLDGGRAKRSKAAV